MPCRLKTLTAGLATLLALSTAGTAQISTPPPASLFYAGGPYPISIAKTAVDSAGNTYVIGGWIPEVPLNGSQIYYQHDLFVSKVDPLGSIVWLTYLGGRGDDIAEGIAVDSSGNVFGVGSTTSPDFPLQHAIQTGPSNGLIARTGFLFKLDTNGALVFSTYFGGSGLVLTGSSVNAVAVDGAGNAFVTGTSDAADFPATLGAFQQNGNVSNQAINPAASAFVAKISPSGAILYATWLGGSKPNCNGGSQCQGYLRQDNGTAIAVDTAGSAYVAGYTDSVDFPVTSGAFQATCSCLYGNIGNMQLTPFVAKLKPDGTGLVYSTYLGSRSGSNPLIAIDTSGNAYVAGSTTSTQFPTTPGVLQPLLGGGLPLTQGSARNVFVSALNPAATALLFSTYFGGTGDDMPTGLAIDSSGNIFLSGTTTSVDFRDTYGRFPAGSGFLAELNPGAKQLVTSMRLLSGAGDRDVRLDPQGGVIAAGSSGYLMNMRDFRVLPRILGVGNAANGSVDNALAPGELISIYGTGIGPSPSVTAQPDSGKYPDSLGGFQVLFNDTPAPLTYASDTQINAVDSADLFTSPVVTVKIVSNGVTVAQITLPQAANRPGIFRNGASAAALNQDGTINSASNPAKSGSIVSIWATGASLFDNASGYVTTSVNVQDYLDGSLQVLGNEDFLTSGGGFQVIYAGPAPGLISAVFQINLQLPQDSPETGPVTILLRAGGVVSPPALIYVAP
jgi:uncharacterized protein (TIGR03437 family)